MNSEYQTPPPPTQTLIDPTLIQRHDVESTLNQCWVNNEFLLEWQICIKVKPKFNVFTMEGWT